MGVWGLVSEFEWEFMSVMVRVEKFKILQNKACLPSLRCYLLCPGYFGGDSLFFRSGVLSTSKESPPNYSGHNK